MLLAQSPYLRLVCAPFFITLLKRGMGFAVTFLQSLLATSIFLAFLLLTSRARIALSTSLGFVLANRSGALDEWLMTLTKTTLPSGFVAALVFTRLALLDG